MTLALLGTPVLIGMIAALAIGALVTVFLMRGKAGGAGSGAASSGNRIAADVSPEASPLQKPTQPASPSFAGTAAQKMAALEQAGISLSDGVTLETVAESWGMEELDRASMPTFLHLISGTIEEEPWTPLCRSLLSFDTECIEGNEGEYADKIRDVAALTQGELMVTEVVDKFDFEGERELANGAFEFDALHVTINFRWNGQLQELKFEQKGDWFDPRVMAKLDELLQASGSQRRFFGLPSDGQNALFGFLLPEQIEKLSELTGLHPLSPAEAVVSAVGEGQDAEASMIEELKKDRL